MAYYLGRDVKVWILSEDAEQGVTVASNAVQVISSDAGLFAGRLLASAAADGSAVSDLTGVDLSLGATDEDISYMGQKSVLKAEIKKETTVSLTRKKFNNCWDVVFNGPIAASGCSEGDAERQVGGRWGVHNDLMSAGLRAPKDHLDGTGSAISYGYRVIIQLKNDVQAIAIPNCCIVSHGTTLSADGVTEETIEFMSSVNPIITAQAQTGLFTPSTSGKI